MPATGAYCRIGRYPLFCKVMPMKTLMSRLMGLHSAPGPKQMAAGVAQMGAELSQTEVEIADLALQRLAEWKEEREAKKRTPEMEAEAWELEDKYVAARTQAPEAVLLAAAEATKKWAKTTSTRAGRAQWKTKLGKRTAYSALQSSRAAYSATHMAARAADAAYSAVRAAEALAQAETMVEGEVQMMEQATQETDQAGVKEAMKWMKKAKKVAAENAAKWAKEVNLLAKLTETEADMARESNLPPTDMKEILKWATKVKELADWATDWAEQAKRLEAAKTQ